jgi:hypothetical protein
MHRQIYESIKQSTIKKIAIILAILIIAGSYYAYLNWPYAPEVKMPKESTLLPSRLEKDVPDLLERLNAVKSGIDYNHKLYIEAQNSHHDNMTASQLRRYFTEYITLEPFTAYNEAANSIYIYSPALSDSLNFYLFLAKKATDEYPITEKLFKGKTNETLANSYNQYYLIVKANSVYLIERILELHEHLIKNEVSTYSKIVALHHEPFYQESEEKIGQLSILNYEWFNEKNLKRRLDKGITLLDWLTENTGMRQLSAP